MRYKAGNFGTQLKKIMIKKGITQKEVARKSGLSKVMISQFSLGRRDPSLESLLKLLYGLEVTLEELYNC